jgi:predicted secreted protein
MNSVLAFAVFVVLWWVVLFAVLPIGLKTQDDEQDITLGTVSSAPSKASHVVKSMIWATLLSIALFAAFYALSSYFGIGIDDIPRIVPEFD